MLINYSNFESEWLVMPVATAHKIGIIAHAGPIMGVSQNSDIATQAHFSPILSTFSLLRSFNE